MGEMVTCDLRLSGTRQTKFTTHYHLSGHPEIEPSKLKTYCTTGMKARRSSLPIAAAPFSLDMSPSDNYTECEHALIRA